MTCVGLGTAPMGTHRFTRDEFKCARFRRDEATSPRFTIEEITSTSSRTRSRTRMFVRPTER